MDLQSIYLSALLHHKCKRSSVPTDPGMFTYWMGVCMYNTTCLDCHSLLYIRSPTRRIFNCNVSPNSPGRLRHFSLPPPPPLQYLVPLLLFKKHYLVSRGLPLYHNMFTNMFTAALSINPSNEVSSRKVNNLPVLHWVWRHMSTRAWAFRNIGMRMIMMISTH